MAKLRSKLVLICCILTAALLATGGWFYFAHSTQDVRESALNQLMLVGEVKKHKLEAVYTTASNDLDSLIKTMREKRRASSELLIESHAQKKAMIEDYLNGLYADVSAIRKDKEVQNATRDFVNAQRASAGVVGSVHAQYFDSLIKMYESTFRGLMASQKWRNMLVINTDGYIVYSVTGSGEVGTNLRAHEYNTSSIKDAVAQLSTPGNNGIAIGDFASYTPGGGQQTAFIATSIVNNGKTLGYLALQVAESNINAIVLASERQNLAITSYLFGIEGDKTEFRSNTLADGIEQQSIGIPVSAPFIDEIMASDRPVRNRYLDHKNNRVLVAAEKLTVKGLQWGLVSTMPIEASIIDTAQFEASMDELTAFSLNENKYTDLALIDTDGSVLYAISDSADFQSAVVDSNVAQSNFTNENNIQQLIIEKKEQAAVSFSPHQSSPAGFIVKPLYNNNQIEMFVALGLSMDAIESVMKDREGILNTIDTYLVRPNLRFTPNKKVNSGNRATHDSMAGGAIITGADSVAARAAINGETGAIVSTNHQGKNVVSAYMPIKFGNINWALLVEMDKRDAN